VTSETGVPRTLARGVPGTNRRQLSAGRGGHPVLVIRYLPELPTLVLGEVWEGTTRRQRGRAGCAPTAGRVARPARRPVRAHVRGRFQAPAGHGGRSASGPEPPL